MKIKQWSADVKGAGADESLEPGQFRAVVSVFNNVDSVGDVVVPGAFAEDLARWAKDGPLPIVWSHQWSDPHAHIGHALDAKETSEGLEVLAQLDVEDLEDRQSLTSKVHRLLKSGRIKQMSFAYDVENAGWAERGGREVFELRKLKIHEAGPCLVGANQETRLVAAKATDLAARLKAGDMIDIGHLRDAYSALGALIDAAKTPSPSGEGPPSTEAGQPDLDAANDPAGVSGASAEQSSKVSSAQVAARLNLTSALGGAR